MKNLETDGVLKKAGWEENGGWYWETVYRTNTMSAFNAGRAEAFEEYEPEYLEFIGIEDFRQTPVCASRSGIVKKRTDPFWKSSFPPLHYNCRSTVRPVYAEEAAAFGIKESAEVSFPEVTEGVKERYARIRSFPGGFGERVSKRDLREIQATLIPDDGAVKKIIIDNKMKENVAGSFLDGTVRLNGNHKTAQLLKSAAQKIRSGNASLIDENEYEAMITLYHEYTHGKFPIDNERWKKLGNNAKNKIEILTELYARNKIALRDEIKKLLGRERT